MPVIKKRVRELREAKRLTQDELAELMGVSSVTVSRWETGSRKVSIPQLERMCEVFNASADYLLGIEKSDSMQEFRRLVEFKEAVEKALEVLE